MRVLLVVVLSIVLVGCSSGSSANTETSAGGDDRVPTSVPTVAAPTVTPEPAVTSEPTVTPEPAVTSEPTVTPEPAVTSEPTVTPEPAVTSEPTATSGPTVTPEPRTTAAPTRTPAPTVTLTSTPTAVPTVDLPRGSDVVPDPDKTLEPVNYNGEVRAIRTQGGSVVAVRGITSDGYEVVTPCYNIATITGGLEISGPLDVLIDPGHGGDETGAVGPNGLIEATVNLQVAELLRAELLDRGYSVEMTRYSDHRVAIPARTELANALQPRVFISIHHNGGFPEPFPQAGTEVFVQQGDPESERLGGLVFEEIQTAFADVDIDWMGNLESFGVAWRQNDEGTDLYGVLRRTPDLVSVLTEAMFISTEAEAELLALPETLTRESQALARALERWFETSDPGRGFIEGLLFEGDLGTGGGTNGCVDPPLSR